MISDPTLPVAAGVLMPDTATALQRWYRQPVSEPDDVTGAPGPVQTAHAAVASCREHAADILTEEARLRADKQLSDFGRKTRLIDFAEERILAIDRSVSAARQVVLEFRDSIKLPRLRTATETSAAMTARELEARSLLREMKEHQRIEALKAAANAGDEVTMLAFAHAQPMPLVPMDILDDAVQAFIKGQDPDAFRNKGLADDALARLNEAERVMGMIREHHQAKFRLMPDSPRSSNFPLPHHPPVGR